jgi:hypothetical protein
MNIFVLVRVGGRRKRELFDDVASSKIHGYIFFFAPVLVIVLIMSHETALARVGAMMQWRTQWLLMTILIKLCADSRDTGIQSSHLIDSSLGFGMTA